MSAMKRTFGSAIRRLTRCHYGPLPGLMIPVVAVLAALFLFVAPTSRAITDYLAAARLQYPAILGSRIDNCTLCHYTDTVNWPNRNLFSRDYELNAYNFTAIAGLDSDGDGYTNQQEINARSFPGDRNDRPVSISAPTDWIYLPLILKALPVSTGQYVLIGWNDLGMHCMDASYEDFAVLPPFNTLWAQVIRRGPEPDIVTTGVSVEYRLIDNSYSVVKSNFWDYSHLLFNLARPLLPNIGLAGYGLSGQMHAAGDHFAAEGIPLTQYRDSDLNNPYPYQLAELVAKDAAGNVLAFTQIVAPVSTEMNCQNCHADNGSANPTIATGVIKQNILSLHDTNHPPTPPNPTLMNSRPVLCADCHSSNALNLPGQPGVRSLSLAMHDQHKTITNDCYQCHPGPTTQCLRDVMYQEGLTCQSCHGNMSDVANPAREPWLNEPRCGASNCHGATYGENLGKLYRFSTGHGGVYCQACHGSQHAIYPTIQPNDNIQSIRLQGHAGMINTCTVCHTNNPQSNEGPHRNND